MKSNVKQKTEMNILRILLYILVAAVISIPITCNFVPKASDISIWIEKVQMQEMAWWMLMSPAIYKITGSLIWTYRLNMLMIQAGTLIAAWLMFSQVFCKEKSERKVFLGTLLYMTCPCRVYCCYDLGNILCAVLFMLLPLLGWAVIKIIHGSNRMVGVSVAIITIVLLCDIMVKPIQGTLQEGYCIGEIGGFYPIPGERPGLGAALMIGLAVVVWLNIMEENKIWKKTDLVLGLMAFVLLAGALLLNERPYWSIILFGSAYLVFSISVARGIVEAEKKESNWLMVILPVTIAILCIGSAVYQFGSIIYFRMPIDI